MSYVAPEEETLSVEEAVRDLRERTKEFALRFVKMYAALPKCTQAQVIGKQVLRSGTSVGANYREAHRARSKAEFVSKLGDCLKELDDEARQRGDGGNIAAQVKRGEHWRVPFGRQCEQTTYWLELLVDTDLVPAPRLAALQDECNQLTAIFTTIAKKSKTSLATNS